MKKEAQNAIERMWPFPISLDMCIYGDTVLPLLGIFIYIFLSGYVKLWVITSSFKSKKELNRRIRRYCN